MALLTEISPDSWREDLLYCIQLSISDQSLENQQLEMTSYVFQRYEEFLVSTALSMTMLAQGFLARNWTYLGEVGLLTPDGFQDSLAHAIYFYFKDDPENAPNLPSENPLVIVRRATALEQEAKAREECERREQ